MVKIIFLFIKMFCIFDYDLSLIKLRLCSLIRFFKRSTCLTNIDFNTHSKRQFKDSRFISIPLFCYFQRFLFEKKLSSLQLLKKAITNFLALWYIKLLPNISRKSFGLCNKCITINVVPNKNKSQKSSCQENWTRWGKWLKDLRKFEHSETGIYSLYFKVTRNELLSWLRFVKLFIFDRIKKFVTYDSRNLLNKNKNSILESNIVQSELKFLKESSTMGYLMNSII